MAKTDTETEERERAARHAFMTRKFARQMACAKHRARGVPVEEAAALAISEVEAEESAKAEALRRGGR